MMNTPAQLGASGAVHIISLELSLAEGREFGFRVYADGSYTCFDNRGHFDRHLAQLGKDHQLLWKIFTHDQEESDFSTHRFLFRGQVTDSDVVRRCIEFASQEGAEERYSSPLFGQIDAYLRFLFWRDIAHQIESPIRFPDV